MLNSNKKQSVTYIADFSFYPFFRTFGGTPMFDLTFEPRHCWNEREHKSNPEKDTSTQCLCINISKTMELKQSL